MTFSEFAQGLSPFISNGLPDADYFTDLMGNFIADAAMDSCSALKKSPIHVLGILLKTMHFQLLMLAIFTKTKIVINS